ncbi:MAG: hypothetical protein MUF75_09575 [Bacteroidia bacterium]|jgi:hypothetical protein|nr:hypothetical protein [Bacteroidia bacterium]
MKNIKHLFVAAFLVLASAAFSQNNSKVIAMVTKANWCPVCKEHGPRMMDQVFSTYTDGKLLVISNDITNNESIKGCEKDLKANGLSNLAKESKMTGMITLINAKTKKVISTISVAESTEAVKKAINSALSKAS